MGSFPQRWALGGVDKGQVRIFQTFGLTFTGFLRQINKALNEMFRTCFLFLLFWCVFFFFPFHFQGSFGWRCESIGQNPKELEHQGSERRTEASWQGETVVFGGSAKLRLLRRRTCFVREWAKKKNQTNLSSVQGVNYVVSPQKKRKRKNICWHLEGLRNKVYFTNMDFVFESEVAPLKIFLVFLKNKK